MALGMTIRALMPAWSYRMRERWSTLPQRLFYISVPHEPRFTRDLNALEVVQEIVRGRRLEDACFTLISHSAQTDWRQRRRTAEERLLHATEGVRTTAPRGRAVTGAELLRLRQPDLAAYRTADDHVVSVSSRLEGRFTGKHLALMDLHLDEFVTRRSLDAAVRALCQERRYWLLRTGRQFHVYGDFLLDEGDDWRSWNLRFQLPLALTDDRYVAQSLLWGCNLLRLTGGGRFPTTVPQTVGDEREPPLESLAPAAVQLAQRKHWWQVRKGGTPYVEHLSDVASLAVSIHEECLELGIPQAADAAAHELYACGYLHDCIEDTDTDYDQVVAATSRRVADWVVELSDDKRRPEPERHAEYLGQLAQASLPARIVKLADLLSNLKGLTGHEDETWMERYLPRVRKQLELVGVGLEECSAYGSAVRLVEQRRGYLDALSPPPAGRRQLRATDPREDSG